MEVIGVIDLRDGQAVHARGGMRHRYAPVRVPDGHSARGDPVALARFYTETLGIEALYVADLDAIEGRAAQRALTERLVSVGAPIWLDAGIAGPGAAIDAVASGVARVIVGLETLPSFAVLNRIADAIDTRSLVFGLDLRNGRPATHGDEWTDPPEAIAARAADAKAGAVITLDLARVGTGRGMDLALLSRIRAAVPDTMLLAGGGVAGPADLGAAAAAGCDGVLVASALIDGRLAAGDIRHARSRR